MDNLNTKTTMQSAHQELIDDILKNVTGQNLIRQNDEMHAIDYSNIELSISHTEKLKNNKTVTAAKNFALSEQIRTQEDVLLNGNGTEEDPYIIETAEQLLSLAASTNTTACYSLSFDIDLFNYTITPIGTEAVPFTGHINGNGHVISNLYLSEAGDYAGLFGYATNASFKNIVIKNAFVSGGWSAGILLGYGDVCKLDKIKLINCESEAVTLVGGVTGKLINSNISNCISDGKVTGTNFYAGGICAYLQDGNVENCTFNGTVDGVNYVGGILGGTMSHVYNCTNNGVIHGNDFVGGIAGVIIYPNIMRFVENCYNIGDVSGRDMIGGIAGYAASYNNDSTGPRIASVANSATVKASGSYAGGIIGNAECSISVQSAYNTGEISAAVRACGGIFGRLNMVSSWLGVLANSYNVGKVKKGTDAGSLIGYCKALGCRNCLYLNVQDEGYCINDLGNLDSPKPVIYVKISSAPKIVIQKSALTLDARYFISDLHNYNNGFPLLQKIIYPLGSKTYYSHASSFQTLADTDETKQDVFNEYKYSDAYFKNSSYVYNEHLATMSLNLAMSEFGSEFAEIPNKSQNAVSLLNKIGFTDLDQLNHETAPTKDTIGAVIGNKKISHLGQDYTLIAIAIRGGGYGPEWASNFLIGEEGFHEGFLKARNDIIDKVINYINYFHILGELKFWITGYSRAAATANLVAGELDGGSVVIENCTLEPSNIYTYAFETPCGAPASMVSGEIYNNIFNIINNADVVTKVAPALWGFKRYGIEKLIPCEGTSELYDAYQATMLKHWNTVIGPNSLKTDYVVDNFKKAIIKWDTVNAAEQLESLNLTGEYIYYYIDYEDCALHVFLDETIPAIFEKVFISRENYVSEFQADICNILEIIFTESNEEIFKKLKTKFTANALIFVALFFSNSIFVNILSAKTFLENIVKDVFVETGHTAEEAQSFSESAYNILLKLATIFPSELLTIIQNLDKIGQAHFPELCLSWVRYMDSYYTSEGLVPVN